MTKSNIPFADTIDKLAKAAKAEKMGLSKAKSAFAQMVEIVKENQDFQPIILKSFNDMTDDEKATYAALRDRLAAVYGWNDDKASAYFRHWRMRIKRELQGDSQAKRSRAARKQSIQIPRTDAERWMETLAMVVEEPIAKEVRGAVESILATLSQKLDK